MRISLKWRFLLILVAFDVAISCIFLLFFSRTYQESYEDQVKLKLTNEAALLGNDLNRDHLVSSSSDKLRTLVNDYASRLKVRVTIIQSNGTVIADSESDPTRMDNHLSRPEVVQALQDQVGFQKRYSVTMKTNYLYVALSQPMEDKSKVIIRLSEPMTVYDTVVRGVNQKLLAGSFVFLFIAVIVSYLVSLRFIRPIASLSQAAIELSQGSFGILPISRSKNELGDLTRSFSTMAGQIKAQLETITDEKQILDGIFENMMDGILICSEDGRIQKINPAAITLFGINDEKLPIEGKSLTEVVNYYQLIELVRNTISSGMPQAKQLDLKPYKKYLNVMSTPLDNNGKRSVLVLIQDQTRQRTLERTRQEFVGNVSHELRTPLASLQAINETLQDGAVDDPDAARRFLGMMEVEIEKLSQMVMEMLDLSKIDSGRVKLNKTETNVFDLLSKSVERMKPQAVRAGLSLTLDCVRELPKVQIDFDRMEQVLINLIHNAIKFTPQGGRISVNAREEQGSILLQVDDSGIGISLEDLPRIFERFFKTDRARSSGGTGLGLAIAKHIVEAHGGRINASSSEGVGTSIDINLPIT